MASFQGSFQQPGLGGNQFRYAQGPTNSGPGMANTQQLGYFPRSQWGDNSIQNSTPGFGQPNYQQAPAGGVSGTGYSIPGLIQQQMSDWKTADAANIGRFNDASGYLKQFATPFSPDVIANMKNSNAMLAQGGQNNAFLQQQGLLATEGNGDASSMAAAAAQAQRNGLGAQVGANTNLNIQAALGNNQAGYNVGNSILSHLPQQRANDLSGLMSLTNQMQNQDFQRQMLANQANRPIAPGMSNGKPSLGGGGGWNYGNAFSGGQAGPSALNGMGTQQQPYNPQGY